MSDVAAPETLESVYIKTTQDGRKVEVIGAWVCLEGKPEADHLVILDEHPNRQAILRAVPNATHMAGRLPLTMAEVSVAQTALRRIHDKFDGSPLATAERMRAAAWKKVFADGAE